jgi:hypothetical protein
LIQRKSVWIFERQGCGDKLALFFKKATQVLVFFGEEIQPLDFNSMRLIKSDLTLKIDSD